jgi:outer membrane protein OmpA-like peptidoglycan-associated protein
VQLKKLFEKIILICILLFSIDAKAKEKKNFSNFRLFILADRQKSNLKFEEAEKTYKQILAKNSNNTKANLKLGLLLCYNSLKRDSAIQYLNQANIGTKNDSILDITLALAECYTYTQEYQKALQCLYYSRKKLLKNNNDEIFIDDLDRSILSCKYALENNKANRRVQIENIGSSINTGFSEYVPVVNEADSLLFYTARNNSTTGGAIDAEDGKFFEDVYIAKKIDNEFKEKQKLSSSNIKGYAIGSTRNHESVVSLSYDERQLFYFYKNNLYVSTKTDTGWSDITKLPNTINISDYQNHAFLSSDGKTLYFSSDSKEGYGNLDIFKSMKDASGNWGEAKNLGRKINTPYDDESPTLSFDGKTLYFASKGHNSIGGFDLFKSTLTDTSWSDPINLGVPANSAANDLFLKFNKSETKGYFASDRVHGYGDMDIYSFTYVVNPFDSCRTFEKKPFLTHFDARASIDSTGIPLSYEWEMGDGTKEYGLDFMHPYHRPGKYSVQLNAIDSVSGRVEYKDTSIAIVIENVDFIEIVAPDSAYVNDTIILNAGNSSLKNLTIENYHWQIKDSLLNEKSQEIKYCFLKTGTYTFNLKISSKEDKYRNNVSYCDSKLIKILPAEQKRTDSLYTIYAAKLKEYRANANASNNKDSSLAALNPSSSTSAQNTNTSNKNDPFDQSKQEVVVGKNEIEYVSDSSLLNNKNFVLKTVYFDFNRHSIRKDAAKVAKANLATLKKNPNIVIQLTGSTDSRGSDEYNFALSLKRVDAVVAYLVKNGFDKKRIKSTIGFGESKIENCKNGSNCSEAEHQLNRCVEFKIIGKSK